MKLSDYFAHWEQVHSDTLATFDKFKDDELHYIPFEGSWTAGEIMLHIAETEDGWLRCVIKQEQKAWPEYSLDDHPTTESIKDALVQAHERTTAYLAEQKLEDLQRPIPSRWVEGETIALGWIIWHVLEHEIHHRGELSLILGQLGREGLDV